MPLTASPVLRWLAAACRQDGAPLSPTPIPWSEIISLARRHRVQSLLYAGVTRRAQEIPPEVASQLRAEAHRVAAENLQAAAECRRIRDAFDSADLPLLFVKGLTLSQLAYGASTLKLSRDIDLLVLPEQVGRAGEVLALLGYQAQVSADSRRLARWHRWSKESGWIAPSGLLVELHSRLTDHPGILPDLRANSASQLVEVISGLALPTLRRDALLAYLAVHGASSAWFRLKWLADLQALLGEADATGLDEVHEAMRRLGAGRAASQAMLLLHWVYGMPLSDRLVTVLAADRRARWLASEALRQLEAPVEPTARRRGTVGIHASQLLIGEHWTFPLSEGKRRLGEILFRHFTAG
ncbi:nucleotidyltransferase family protein [Sphingomonas sp. KRR8]|uniref:nucleotidyltransferase domain-containing protein n=1 Tax=Sphingomonas sp. KRR8 TaxID=2942996 RepID=UPI0020221675|nr:nucleotidyltransferase family protein [Sphingomonas sp. KRR8]URD61689.1 nucleotidyltransferase family protein [Sphingomonas sp. KRR8]